MLTKESREVLDYLRSCYYESRPQSISDNVNNIFSSITANEADKILHYLAQNEYLSLKRYIDGSNQISLTHKGLHYEDFDRQTPQQVYTFNAPVTNSAVGNNGVTTVSNGISFDEVRSFIDSQNISAEDKTAANNTVDYVQTLIENDAPLKKGFLSKFSDVLTKHSWLVELISKLIFTYLTGKQI